MKKFTKIAMITLAVAIPVGLFAQNGYYNCGQNGYGHGHNGHGNGHGRHYNKQNMNCYWNQNNTQKNSQNFKYKRANYEFKGKLQSLPKDGLNGVWKVDGYNVIVNDNTLIKEDKKIKAGDKLEITAIRFQGKIHALEIEQD